MLQLNNVDINLVSNGRALLRGLSFTLNPGDRAVIIGEEGNGKSTLLKLIYDPELIEGHAEWSGSITQGDHRLGYLPQDMAVSDRSLPIYMYLERNASFSEKDPRLAAEVSAKLGLPAQLMWDDRPAGTLSGGEKVKLQLAAILLNEPDMLLLDEPTNDIDIETLEWLEGFINSFPGGVLFVSHDETLIENTANMVIHIEHVHHKKVARHTVAHLPYREYIEKRTGLMEHQEQVARKEADEQRKKEERWREIYEKVDSAQRNLSRQDPSTGRLLKKKMHSVMSQGRRIEKERENLTQLPVTEWQIFLDLPPVDLPARKEILRMELPRLTSPDGNELAENVSLSVNAADHIGIIGRNGAGKTTLMRLIEKELIGRKDVKVFYMPQNYADLLKDFMTPVEFLAPTGEKEAVTAARTYLGSVRYTADEAEQPVSRLSGGQKAKLLFVKMALEGYNVLLLDEPTRNFSPLSAPVIRRILSEFGGCIISVTHDRKYLAEVCDKVYELGSGGLGLTRY